MQILAREDGDFAECGYSHDVHGLSFRINGSPSSSCSSPSSSSQTPRFSPLSLIESIIGKSFSYSPLPLDPIKLTVLRLDGSSFDIIVNENATVADLKEAVEASFSEIDKVSWSHVWGQFCLRFEDQKLLHNPDSIGLYGVHDGDQLQFIRHISISDDSVSREERSETQSSNSEEFKVSPSKSSSHDNKQSNGVNTASCCEQDDSSEESEDCDDIGVDMSSSHGWLRLFRGYLYLRLEEADDSDDEMVSSPSSNSSSDSM